MQSKSLKIGLLAVISCLVAGSVYLPHRRGAFTGGGGGGGGDLLAYDDEAYSAGDNLTAAGWTGTSTDDLEISTTYAYSGSNSIKINRGSTGASVKINFTQQTSGQLYMTFWYRAEGADVGSSADEACDIRFIDDVDADKNLVRLTRSERGASVQNIKAYINTTWTDVADTTVGTWYFVVIEIDLDNDDFDMWLDTTETSPTKRLTDQAFAYGNTAVECDAVQLERYGDSGQSIQMYIDELNVYDGSYD